MVHFLVRLVISGFWTAGETVSCLDGLLWIWFHDWMKHWFLASWIARDLVSWFNEVVALWFHGLLVRWFHR